MADESRPRKTQTLGDQPAVGIGHDLTLGADGGAVTAAGRGGPRAEARYGERTPIASGGMGEVHAVMDRQIGREIAIKQLRREVSSADARARFLKEGRIQAQLEHPAVVPVYDLALDAGGAEYITMKRVSGVTLHAALTTEPGANDGAGFSRHKLLHAFLQVCLCVEYAHTRGVIHRDLKPSNVMLGRFGEVYVLDWGIAKLEGERRDHHAPPIVIEDPAAMPEGATGPTTGPTVDGAVLGTPGYMAPEQITGSATVDHRGDVYALGAILFEILCGVPLHPQRTVPALLQATLDGGDARAATRAPARDVPPELEAAWLRATALASADRQPTVRALHDEVERFLDGDRDVELRRELALTHSASASVACERALSGEDRDDHHRRTALHDVGRALALDPSSPSARETLARLLAEPPAVRPPEVAAHLATADHVEARGAARIAAWVLVVTAALAVAISQDTMALTPMLPMIVPCALAAALAFGVGYVGLRHRALPFAIVLLVCFAIAQATGFMGPLVVTPSLAIAIGVSAVSLGRTWSFRITAIIASLLTVAGPALLELTGAISSSYRSEGGALLILPRLMEMPDRPYPIVVLIACLISIVIPLLLVADLSRRNAALRARMQGISWHFQQLVAAPDSARA